MAPRTLRILLVVMTSIVVLGTFFWEPEFEVGPVCYRDSSIPRPVELTCKYPSNSREVSLAMRLQEEEARYAETVKAREGLIKKYGPTKEKVVAYPTHGSYTIWDFFIPSFQCPHRVERVGRLGDGGKWVCGVERIAKQEKCVIYSFGINRESSFEAALLERAPGCEVWGYDFSVTGFGSEINSPRLKERTHFFRWGLAGHNAHGPEDSPKYYTLDTLMRLNGHSFIDVLKIDVEGAEFNALTTFLTGHKPLSTSSSTTLPIGQMQLELHAWDDYEKFAFFHDWWAALEGAGLRPFWTESNLVYVNYNPGKKPTLAEYSFMNIRGNYSLVYDADDKVLAY